MRRLLQLLDRNRASAHSLRLVAGYDPDFDGDTDEPDAPDVDDPSTLGDEATLYVYSAIGGWDWDGEAVTAKKVIKQLSGLEAKTLHVRINSPGGDVFEARAIKTALEQVTARVVAHIDSLAASAASFLMLAADEIEIAPGAFVMIHNPWGFAVGDASEMRATADLLDKVGAVIAADYQGKTKIAMDDLRTMMNAETWLDADEAVAKGFADRIMEKAPKAAARFDLSAFRNAPKASFHGAEPPPSDAAFAQLETDRARALARLSTFA